MATHIHSSIGASSNKSGDGASNVTLSSILPTDMYAQIDASSVDTHLWMVKIPTKLAEAWGAAEPGSILGELVFTKGSAVEQNQQSGSRESGQQPQKPHTKQSLKITVPEALDRNSERGAQTTSEILPLDYTIEAMTKKMPVMHPFTRNSDGSIALHGTVSRSAILQMQQSVRYRNLCKSRLLSTVTTDRFVRPVDTSELSMKAGRGAGAGTSDAGFGDAVQRHGKRMLEAAERASSATDFHGIKKQRFDGQSIRSVIFELFSIQPHWTVKELRSSSGRTEKDIRPVLTELCEFKRSGENKGTWELKKEFRMQEDREEGDASAASGSGIGSGSS